MGGSELSSKTISKTLRAVSARESAHADHASQETLRPPILPTLDPLSLPLPSQHHSTVRSPAGCHTNRYADRSPSRGEPTSHDLPTKGASDVCLHSRNGARIFRWDVRCRKIHCRFLRTHPHHPALRE